MIKTEVGMPGYEASEPKQVVSALVYKQPCFRVTYAVGSPYFRLNILGSCKGHTVEPSSG